MHKVLRSSSMTHGDEKKVQSRNTPRLLVPSIVETLQGVDGDPCCNVRSIVPATARIFLPRKKPRRGLRFDVVVGDGLELDWAEVFGAPDVLALHGHARPTVFCNPPWDDLGRWIPKIVAESRSCDVLALLPLRSHRRYWAPTWTASGFCFIEAIAYEGFGNKMAIPCVVLYWGRAVRRFRSIWSPWGHVLTSNHGSGTLTHMPMPPDSEVNPNHVRMRLLGACIPLLSENELLEAVDVGLQGATYGEIWALVDDLTTAGFSQASANLQHMVESMPFRATGQGHGSPASPSKRKKGKKALTNGKRKGAKKTSKKASKKNGANGAKKTTKLQPDELDARVEEDFLRGDVEEIRTADIAERYGVSKATALRSMQRFEQAGKAKLEGVGRGAKYTSLVRHSRPPVEVVEDEEA